MYYLSKLLSSNTNIGKKLVISRYKTKIMKYLNVAEKRDAARNIAGHLSRGNNRNVPHKTCDFNEKYGKIDNCISACYQQITKINNGIYTFEAEVLGQKSNMVMTSVSGHLLNYAFVNEAVKSWKKCNPKTLFKEKVAKKCPTIESKKIKEILEYQIRACDGLIIWTDCDREGENIGFEIIDVCRAKKRNIQIYRAKFSEITLQSVTRALSNLEQPNEHISKAVDIRQELDLRIGAVFTRLQTLTLQLEFPNYFSKGYLSYGSCQFPTLGFVVDRYTAIVDFVPEPFWKLQVTHNDNNLSTVFYWDRVRIFDEEICKVLHDVCLENGVAKVEDVKTKPKSKWRPLPLDTVELEKLASRKLNITAKETMSIAEKLYIGGNISYPRTETNKFSKDINLKKLVELQRDDPNWGQFAQNVLTHGPNPRQGNKTDEAHPPIHPTKYNSNLSGNEKRLYEFIVRSFLACCSKDAQGQETTVTINVGDEIFRASGLLVQERNYLDVYPYDKWSSKEIAAYEAGTTFRPTKIDMEAGTTTPPQLLTEADLIALMEKHGIGTDATHADHIETIKKRKYVVFQEHADMSDDTPAPRNKRSKTFIPTKLGMSLVKAYEAMKLTISKPKLRAQFEADLKLICEGKKNPEIVLNEELKRYEEIFNSIENNVRKLTNTVYEYYIKESEPPLQDTESAAASGAPNGVPTSVNGSVHQPSASNSTSSSIGGSVVCHCNQPARSFTSRQQNENQGRKFFKCCKDDGCNFFQWAGPSPGTHSNPTNVINENVSEDAPLDAVHGAAPQDTPSRTAPTRRPDHGAAPRDTPSRTAPTRRPDHGAAPRDTPSRTAPTRRPDHGIAPRDTPSRTAPTRRPDHGVAPRDTPSRTAPTRRPDHGVAPRDTPSRTAPTRRPDHGVAPRDTPSRTAPTRRPDHGVAPRDTPSRTAPTRRPDHGAAPRDTPSRTAPTRRPDHGIAPQDTPSRTAPTRRPDHGIAPRDTPSRTAPTRRPCARF